MSIAPTSEDNDERFSYGLSPNTSICEYQDADQYSVPVVRETQLLQSKQDRSEYVLFMNLSQERFSRDFDTDWTAFVAYYTRSLILMTKLEMDTQANAKNGFNIALIQKLPAWSPARARCYGRSIDRDSKT